MRGGRDTPMPAKVKWCRVLLQCRIEKESRGERILHMPRCKRLSHCLERLIVAHDLILIINKL